MVIEGTTVTGYIKELPPNPKHIPMNKRTIDLIKYIRAKHPELNY
jgi:hypothetical protein